MSFLQLQPQWVIGDGPYSDIVLSSRVRLARNVMEVPFPRQATVEQLRQLVKEVEEIKNENKKLTHLKLLKFADLPLLERKILVEKHLISFQHGQNEEGALLLEDNGAVSVMINEEDHLRIQCILSGLQLEEALEQADKVDDALTFQLKLAYDDDFGYLTCCPTNVGTGLRASVMLHLPALKIIGRLEPILRSITKVGLTVRGTYGEGSQVYGNIFQISNQVTLGRNEQEIVDNIQRVTMQIVEHEKNARDILLKNGKIKLKDLAGRAYGILSNASLLSIEEAMRLLSDLRLGVDNNLLEDIQNKLLNDLLISIHPAHLSKLYDKDLAEGEQDIYRAILLREKLRGRN